MKIEIETAPTPADEQVVWRGLRQHNDAHVSAAGDATFAVFLRGTGGTILGGVLAKTGRGWLHIHTLWVDPSVRGQGYGTKLMAAAEAEYEAKCIAALTSAMPDSWQAAAWWLERRRPRVYGKQERLHVLRDVARDISQLSDDDVALIAYGDDDEGSDHGADRGGGSPAPSPD